MNVNVGKDVTIRELHERFDAVYVAMGAADEQGIRSEGGRRAEGQLRRICG